MKITRILVIGLGLGLALATAVAAQLDSQLGKAQAVIEKHASTIENQKLTIDGMASEITYLGTEVETMKSQAELVAMLNSEHEKQTIAITDTGNDWQVNSNKMQVSEHEPTRTWAAATLPDHALRMLHEASRSQDSHSKAASLRPTSIKHDGLWLSATAI